MKPIIELILNRSWLVVLAFLIATALVVSGVRNLSADTGVEGSLPDHHPIVTLNDQIKNTYGSNDATIALLEGDIYTQASFDRLYALTRALEARPDVESVTSLANATHAYERGGELITEDMISKPGYSAAQIGAVRDYLKESYLYQNINLVGQDGRSTVLVVTPKAGVVNSTFAAPLRSEINKHWDGPVSMAGNSVIGSASEKVIKHDLPRLVALSIVLILTFLFLNFRTWHGIVLPLLVIVAGVAWGMGLFGWLGQKMMTLTVIAPIAVLAVAASFALHLLGRYFFELAHGQSKHDALVTTFTQTSQGVLISGVAISAAMLTFLLSSLSMVRGLGLLTMLGVTSSLIAALVLLPAVLNVLPTPKVRLDPENPGPLGTTLRRLSDWIALSRKAVMLTAAALVVVSLFGITRIVPNTSFLAFFPANSELVQGVNKVEQTFGASSALSVVVDADLQDPKVLQAMLDFQGAVDKLPNVGTATSFATVVRHQHEVLSGEPNLPKTSAAVSQELLLVNATDLKQFVTPDYAHGLINVGVKNLPTSETKELEAEVRALAEQHLAPVVGKLQIGGSALNNLATEEALIHDFLISLTLAIALVVIIDSFVRSLRAAIITITSLVVTIALQYGVLGLLGLPLNLATMLMGALSIGVGDYAIHLTVRYMEERRSGLNPEQAMSQAIYTSGRSIVFTALTLGSGFAALILAGFVPVQTLGALMVFTVTAVGITSLTLLPAICLSFLRGEVSSRDAESEGLRV